MLSKEDLNIILNRREELKSELRNLKSLAPEHLMLNNDSYAQSLKIRINEIGTLLDLLNCDPDADYQLSNIKLDHIDIVTSHMCNNNCVNCIDKFIHTSNTTVTIEGIENFLQLIRKHTDNELEVLLLGGEPTVLDTQLLINIAKKIKEYHFKPIMSTNGIEKEKIKAILPYYDWIQITVHSDRDIDYWKNHADKINIKIAGDKTLTYEKLRHFIDYTTDFSRRSVSMYFTPDFKELCEDKAVWNLLNQKSNEWVRNGSYEYMFYEGVRFKKCIHGETNIIDEPTVPKYYPNGNYNKTWNNEDMDAYLGNL